MDHVSSHSASASHIVIDTDLGLVTVAGNGRPSYGFAPFSNNPCNNAITVNNDGSVNAVFGGRSESEDVTDNLVIVHGGKVETFITGGSSNEGAAKENTVYIEGGEVSVVMGGGSENGVVKGNRVSISAGAVYESIIAGSSINSDARNNDVVVSGGLVSGPITGGYSSSGAVENNTIEISDGIVYGSIIAGMNSSGLVIRNTITVSGGTVINCSGGYTKYGDAIKNSVIVEDGTVSEITGGSSVYGDAKDNTILIAGGTISGTLTGGFTESGNAVGNTITISDGEVDGYLYGGGGGDLLNTDYFSGNTLNLRTAGLTVNGIHNFQYLNFFLPANLKKGEVMLSVNGIATLGYKAGLSSVVSITICDEVPHLSVGDKIILIDASAGTLATNTGLNTTAICVLTQDAEFSIEVVNNQLLATLTKGWRKSDEEENKLVNTSVLQLETMDVREEERANFAASVDFEKNTGFAYDRFEKFRTRLVETTVRNRLLNYRHPVASCIRIIDEVPDQLFSVLKDGIKLDFLAVPQPKQRELQEAIDSDLLKIEKKSEIPPAEVWAKHLKFNTEYELPESSSSENKHNDKSIQTLLYEVHLDARLRQIKSRADTALSESGVNILYLAFGFLEWYESENSNRLLLSPLFTVPVALERERDKRTGRVKYFVSMKDESLLTNISLRERLAHDFDLLLPDIDENESTPEAYFHQVREILSSSFPRWKIRRYGTLCLLNFSKQVMYNDLDLSNWQEGIGFSENDVLKGIFASNSTELESNVSGVDEPYEIDALTDVYEKFPLIADADSSQHSALIDAVSGHNLVIVGPPGTGKSQTITNLIAACIANGKKVLFVAEKMAALNVVKDRLDKSGLGDFCLEIHSHKTNKAEIAKSLGESLEHNREFPSIRHIDDQIDILRKYVRQLNDYAGIINSKWGKTDLTLHEIFCRAVYLRESYPTLSEKITIPGIDPLTITPAGIRQLQDDAKVLESLYHQVAEQTSDGKITSHYWYGVRDSNSSQQIVQALEQWTSSLKQLLQKWSDASIRLSSNATQSVTLEHINEFLTAAKNLPSLKEPRLLPEFAFLHKNAAQIEYWLEDYRQILSGHVTLSGTIKQDDILNQESLEIIRNATEFLLSSGVSENLSITDIDSDTGMISELHKVMQELEQQVSEVNKPLPDNVKPIFATSMQGLRRLKTFLTIARKLPHELWGERHHIFDAHELDGFLEEFEPIFYDLNQIHGRLIQRFALNELPGTEVLRKLQTTLEDGGFFRWFSSEWRASRKTVLSFSLKPASDKASMQEWFPEVVAYSRKKDELDTLHRNRPLLGDLYKGLFTPLTRIQTLRNWYKTIRNEYGYTSGENASLVQTLFSLSKETSFAFLGSECELLLAQIELIEKNLDFISKRYPSHSCFRQGNNPFSLESDTIYDLEKNLRTLSVGCSKILNSSATTIYDINAIYDQLFLLQTKFQDWQAHDLTRKWVPSVFSLFPPTEQVYSVVKKALENGMMVADAIHQSKLVTVFLSLEPTRERYIQLKDIADSIQSAWVTQDANKQRFSDVSNINYQAWIEVCGSELKSIIRRNQAALSKLDWLTPWLEYMRLRKRLSDDGLQDVLEELENQGIQAENLVEIVDLAINNVLAKAILDLNPSLKQFSGMVHQALRERFRETDEKLTELQRQKIAHQISSSMNLPAGIGTGPVRNFTERHLVKHEAKKRRSHIPVRELLKRAGATIQALKPCFMMSPMSVAQYLEPGRLEFDIVIMDEASQIKPEDAIGAIARSKQLVVVGDPEQLPPTTFFDRILGDDEFDEDQLAAEQSESILDAVSNIFRKRSLKWHYRSRHESLIAFSNMQFYRSNLIVFPSIHAKSKEYGIKFEYVNGRFISRRNSIEAKGIVEALALQLLENPHESVGVVAMNAEQMEEIERTLESALESDPVLAEAHNVSLHNKEPFFIKNLENVQGDERDVIFISMTYGPENVNGNVRQNFGPINREYGYRRLNVLMTRSKKRMHVFSSMKSADINVRPESSRGVQALQAFLYYCETKRLDSAPKATGRQPDSDFEREVMRQLKDHGFECEPQVGVRGFSIDIAVRDPGRPGQYLMGIECDGASYHSAKSARDRDRLRQQILEDNGWLIRRIWSTDWFRNPHAQILPIVNELNRIKTPVIESGELIHEVEAVRVGAGSAVTSEESVPDIDDVVGTIVNDDEERLFFHGNMKEQFAGYLRERGYKGSTLNIYPNSIEKVCKLEKTTWEGLAKNISSIVVLYDKGGEKENDGSQSNNQLINALKRFSEYLATYKDGVVDIASNDERPFSHVNDDVIVKEEDDLKVHLETLEKKIREAFPDTDESKRLLRPEMMRIFLEYKPFSRADFGELVPEYLRLSTDVRESADFLDEVLRIIETYA